MTGILHFRDWSDMDVAMYALVVGAFAIIAAVAIVSLYADLWGQRAKIIAALRGHHVPQADLEAPHASASTQLRRDRSAVEPTREVEAA